MCLKDLNKISVVQVVCAASVCTQELNFVNVLDDPRYKPKPNSLEKQRVLIPVDLIFVVNQL